MSEIATPGELTREIERVLRYAQSESPSRVRLASELRDLSARVVARSRTAAAVDPLHPDDVEDYFATACKSLRKYYRDFEVVQRPGPVRDPEAYDMEWRLRLSREVLAAVMVSFDARRGFRLQVTEQKFGKVDRILDETLTRGSQYGMMIESCLSHWYDRHQAPW